MDIVLWFAAVESVGVGVFLSCVFSVAARRVECLYSVIGSLRLFLAAAEKNGGE